MSAAPSGRKNVVIILNGISLNKKIFYHHILPRLSKLCNTEVYETLSKNDAFSLASRATEKYPDVILAAGGDGTLNQVLNGVLKDRESETKLPAIGIIPIGSGNDFARTAGIQADVKQLERLLEQFTPKKIDIGRIEYTPFPATDPEYATTERYFVNVADAGMGPLVVDKVIKSGRPFGHALAYYQSILSTFATYKPMKVKAVAKDWSWEGKLRTLAVANGKCYGHGMYIAPDALPDDRLFNVFICGNVSVLDFIWHTKSLKKGKHIDLPDIHYKTTTALELTSDRPCMVEADGEILGTLPAKITLTENCLDFLI